MQIINLNAVLLYMLPLIFLFYTMSSIDYSLVAYYPSEDGFLRHLNIAV